MRFEKVSFDAFCKDCLKYGHIVYRKVKDDNTSYIENLDNLKQIYDEIKLPKRSTSKSCGYDFFNPFHNCYIYTRPNFIPTGIKVLLDDDKFLMVCPRSSSGKKRYRMSNTLGIIDCDYYNNPDNEGDIIIALEHTKPGDMYCFKQGEAIAQGIILPFFTMEDDNAEGDRLGGFGSTDNVNQEVN
jgi:dUTP pyrophosphatase